MEEGSKGRKTAKDEGRKQGKKAFEKLEDEVTKKGMWKGGSTKRK